MLIRSRKSAFIMAVVYTITLLTVEGLAVLVRYSSDIVDLEINKNVVSNTTNNVMELIIVIAIFVLVVGFGLTCLSHWIYAGDNSHFGFKGALRWVITAVLCVLLMQPIFAVIPSSRAAKSGWLAGVYTLLKGLCGLLVFELSYRLVFKWLPFTRGQRVQQ